METNKFDWICTDPNNNQYGKRLSETKFKFRQTFTYPNGNTINEHLIIDLSNYSDDQKQKYIEPFGYSLVGLYEEMSKDDANWLVAECIFEMTV